MTVRVYKSTFPGMSGVSSTAGTLISTLDKILVNGTSGVSITSINRTGGTATVVTAAAHGLCTSAWVTISGADQSEYNGDKQITVVDTTTFTYTVSGTPVTPATGTITYGMTAAGWTKPHSDTNKAAYRQGSHISNPNQFYLYVDDTVGGYANIRGYEAMNSITDTGNTAFPTTTQQTNWYAPKSSAASARGWIAVANERTVYLVIDYYGSLSAVGMGGLVFGDLGNYDINDNYAIGIIGSASVSAAEFGRLSQGTGATLGLYVSRIYAGTGTSATYRVNSSGIFTTTAGAIGPVYANPPDSRLILHKLYCGDISSINVRGELPGVYAPVHATALSNGDTFTASGDLAGKRFVILHVSVNSLSVAGRLAIEITNGW